MLPLADNYNEEWENAGKKQDAMKCAKLDGEVINLQSTYPRHSYLEA